LAIHPGRSFESFESFFPKCGRSYDQLMQICCGMISCVRRRGTMAAMCVLATSLLTACTGGVPSPEPVSGTSSDVLSCPSAIGVGPLPTWAQVGFSPPGQPVRQVRGIRGQILGVVFADPLRAPPKPGHGNKILWLAAPGASSTSGPADPSASAAMRIDATLAGGQLTVRRTVPGGPGPSLVDMPRAGCWRFDLTWDGHQDTVMLPYSPP
jgi:hypothetical protein